MKKRSCSSLTSNVDILRSTFVAAVRPGTILTDGDTYHPRFAVVVRKNPATFTVKFLGSKPEHVSRQWGQGGSVVPDTTRVSREHTMRYRVITSEWSPPSFWAFGKLWKIWNGRPVKYEDYLD